MLSRPCYGQKLIMALCARNRLPIASSVFGWPSVVAATGAFFSRLLRAESHFPVSRDIAQPEGGYTPRSNPIPTAPLTEIEAQLQSIIGRWRRWEPYFGM